MQDSGLFWLLALLVLLAIVWRFKRKPKSPPVLPPMAHMPAPLERERVQASPQMTRSSRNDDPPPRPKTKEPLKAKRPWLRGRVRIDWQKQQQAEAERRRKEDFEAAREIAAQRAAEKAAADEIARQKSLADATARMAAELEKKARLAGQSAEDRKVEAAWHDYRRQPVPPDIQRSINAFLAGEFQGPEQSPLTYVGYPVGVAQGLSPRDRQRRIEVCFRVEVPDSLRSAYRDWAESATTQRLNAMMAHVRRHADMRRNQPGFERAVSEWDEDRIWMHAHLAPLAREFTRGWSVIE